MASATHVRATTSFVCEVKREQVIIAAGTVLSASDPTAKAHPELFELVAEKKT